MFTDIYPSDHYSQLDGNSAALEDYHFNQDQDSHRSCSEFEWLDTIPEKREAVRELACRIILQDVDIYTFNTAFEDNYLNQEDDVQELLYSSLEEIVTSGYAHVPEAKNIALRAIEAACFCLYNCKLDDLFPDNPEVTCLSILNKAWGKQYA